MSAKLRKQWGAAATAAFKGKTVAEIRYTSPDDNDEMMWSRSAPVIVFSDGTTLMAMSDDEGNDAGALSSSIESIQIIPTIR